jgi:hypothetical protein
VGKTLLAEILAESYRPPLMLLRLTEFGLDLSTFGQNLKEQMHLSSRWGAVLVMYENKASHKLACTILTGLQ